MPLERSATILPRLVLCLSLLVATAGLAQDSEASPPAGTAPTDAPVSPPPMPAGESPEQPASPDEGWPHEQEGSGGGGLRLAGRLLLQPPAGILGGAVVGFVSAYPAFTLSFVTCEALFDDDEAIDCLILGTYAGTALGVSIGAGIGVMAIGHLLDGRGQMGAALAGALAGSAVGAAIGFSYDMDFVDMSVLLFVGPVVGATLLYTLSDAFFPGPARKVAPAREEVDEYARVLPMISTTRTGGIIGGIVGRF
jgi:hypothetical protein